MKIADLSTQEQLVMGALIRMLVRLDGEFSESEETRMNEVGDAIGGRDKLWRVISDSAQAMPDEAQVREATASVARPEARALILQTLERIAEADDVVPREQELLDWVRETFGGSPSEVMRGR